MKRSVLVTGASKGIGRAIAIKLAQQSFDVTVHYLQDIKGAQATAAAIMALGQSARLLSFDVSNRQACQQALEADMAKHGHYYGVVLNAGIAKDAAFPSLSERDWHDVIHTNLDAFYHVLQPVSMPMIAARQGGRIVTVSSISGLMGNRGQVNYSASKAGLMGATKALALELAKRKITVNCVAPGLIDTGMIDEQVLKHALPLIPANRMGTPEEVAALVGFLMSDEAAYITRQVISVNGGMA